MMINLFLENMFEFIAKLFACHGENFYPKSLMNEAEDNQVPQECACRAEDGDQKGRRRIQRNLAEQNDSRGGGESRSEENPGN